MKAATLAAIRAEATTEQDALEEFNNLPMKVWAGTTILVLLFAVVPSTSFHLDDNSDEFSSADDAINQANREQRLAKAGKTICGENAAWQVEGNTLQCFTRKGKKTITATVQP